MTLFDVKPDELLEPEVLFEDFVHACERVRPSVSPGDLRAHENFTAKYGMEG